MAKPSTKRTWYLQEWMALRGKRQADMVSELNWLKPRASKVFNNRHDYRGAVVDELSAWLEIEPYELLMRPQEALDLRRLRETAQRIASSMAPPEKLAAERSASFEPAPVKSAARRARS